MTITNLTDKELQQAQRIAELEAEVERLKAAAKYAEHIDATPENQRETMLHDALTERNALRAQIETLQRDAKRYRWFSDIAVSGDFEKAEEAFACFADAESCTEQELDAAIDAAIAAMGGAND